MILYNQNSIYIGNETDLRIMIYNISTTLSHSKIIRIEKRFSTFPKSTTQGHSWLLYSNLLTTIIAPSAAGNCIVSQCTKGRKARVGTKNCRTQESTSKY